MKKRTNISDMFMKLAILVMTIMMAVACSKSDGDDNKGSGGGQTPTPDPPTPSTPSQQSGIKYELSPTAVLVPEATAKSITNVDTVGYKFTMPLNGSKPEVGQCLIINTPTTALPDGLLAKVKSVKETSSDYEVSYQDAELKDAFKELHIPEQEIALGEYVQHVYDANGKEVKFARVPNTRAKGVKNFNISIPEISWELLPGLELTPKMSMDITLYYTMQYGDYQIDYVGAKIDNEVTLAEDIAFTLDKASLVEYEKPLLYILCGGIPVGPIVITPGIEVSGIFKADGKLALEASISYKRMLHANLRYQAKGGLNECSLTLDPPADDAFQFTFGPKFEGGFSVGALFGCDLGIYKKVFSLRSRITAMMKESISGKVDFVAFTGNGDEWLEAANPSPSAQMASVVKNAKKWKFGQFENLMLNQALVTQLGIDVITLGKKVTKKDFPEMTSTIDSSPICPQVKVDDKDFLMVDNGNEVTLMLHHPSKSVLDGFTEYRAEFKPAKGGAAISKHFNFDDDIRTRLIAQVKNDDVTTEIKTKLNYGEDYALTVYMNLLSLDIPVFKGTVRLNEPKVDPTELEFKAEGGTQKVKIEKGTYQYCGVDVASTDASWLSAKVNSDGTVSVTAKANSQENERVATVNCWVSSKESPKDSEKVLLPITVKQEGKIDSWELTSVSVSMYYAHAWRSDLSFKPTDEGVTITPLDKGVKVVLYKEGKDSGANAEWKYTVSFEVDDLSLMESKKAKLSNFRYEMNKDGGGYDYYKDHIAWTKETTILTSNAAMTQSSNGRWYFTYKDLSYYYKSTIHYDRWKKDIYSEAIEKTFETETTEMTEGSSVSIGLNVKKN